MVYSFILCGVPTISPVTRVTLCILLQVILRFAWSRWFLYGSKPWGQYHRPSFRFICLPLSLPKRLRVVWCIFRPVTAHQIFIHNFGGEWTIVYRIWVKSLDHFKHSAFTYSWLDMPIVTLFRKKKSFSRSFSCSVSERTHVSMSSNASTKAGCWWVSFDYICETMKRFPTRMDSVAWCLARLLL